MVLETTQKENVITTEVNLRVNKKRHPNHDVALWDGTLSQLEKELAEELKLDKRDIKREGTSFTIRHNRPMEIYRSMMNKGYRIINSKSGYREVPALVVE
tara:strand:+ start:135 stop:434 length:300 start_codon:yes stop_codon:yes gene_type:complete